MDEEYKYLEPAETKRVKNLIRKVALDINKRTTNKYSRDPKNYYIVEIWIKFYQKNLLERNSLKEEALEEEFISDDEEDYIIMATHFGKKKTTRKAKKDFYVNKQ